MFGRGERREREREGWEGFTKRQRGDDTVGWVQTERTYRLVILGSSEHAMGSPAGTALPGWDHSRQTAVIYIDKAVRGEVASRMVMDADLGGRWERGRKRSGEEERNQEMSEEQRQISDFVCVCVCSIWIILSTHSNKTVSDTIRGFFAFCKRSKALLYKSRSSVPVYLRRLSMESSPALTPLQQEAIWDAPGRINISCLCLSFTWGLVE